MRNVANERKAKLSSILIILMLLLLLLVVILSLHASAQTSKEVIELQMSRVSRLKSAVSVNVYGNASIIAQTCYRRMTTCTTTTKI